MGEYDEDPSQEHDDLLDGHGRVTPADLFVKTATGIKKVLPSIFNLKVVSEALETTFGDNNKRLS
jgi:hypothetical protein